MLPDAISNFDSPCLTGGWLSYGAFAGVFCMIASFGLQLLEIASVAHFNKLRRFRQEQLDAEKGMVTPADEGTVETLESKISKQNNVSQIESRIEVCSHHDPEHHHIGDDHGHTHAAFLDDEEAYKHIGTYILELGIVMHSILIGITLATTANSEFVTLLIALVFHQVPFCFCVSFFFLY
jgi:zinc transporter 1/2/3